MTSLSWYNDEANQELNTGSSDSHNASTRRAGDAIYQAAVQGGENLRYWVPSASKLSRGKKGTIQRMFTGEPLKNSCNVYVYNQTTQDWKLEYQIRGDPTRRGALIFPPSNLTGSPQTVNGLTYTATHSLDSGSASAYEVFRPFSTDGGVSWQVEHYYDSNYDEQIAYPHNQPSGWSGGTWVAGTYVGTTSLGGVSGEWLKLQVSTGIQPKKWKMDNLDNIMDEFLTVETFTILGSNDDSNWTNLGNFTNNRTDPMVPHIEGTLTISTTYTYFALVLKSRKTDSWSSGDNEYIAVPAFTLFVDDPSEDFGRSLDGTDNADMVAVGAPGTFFGSISHIDGYAYVFTKDSNGNGWTQRGTEVSQQGGFGHSVALSQYDGNILVVGAPFYRTFEVTDSAYIPLSEGRVYIYKWNGANYTLQQTLNSPSGTLDLQQHGNTPLSNWATWKNFYFGYSLGVTDIGDKIIVGEPSLRNIWDQKDQLQGQQGTFEFTGNAHVYDNFTVLSGGTNWTSNVSMTSVIGVTGIGLTSDTHPTKVRWLDALGHSVDINRAGTRILAGGPGSYGTSNTAPHAMSGRIYTLDWDPVDAEWKEMGQDAKHIAAPQGNMMLGWSTRFDGSGRRIVTGATGYIDTHYTNKGNVIIFDWNGDQWVSFPNEMVDIRSWNVNSNYSTNYQHKLGESISVDGEGEMVSIGKAEAHKSHGSPPVGGLRPNAFTVPDITYIGGATTTVSGSNSQVDTGMSNIWVYNINQSMVVKGNVTVGGYIQGTGVSIGTNDDSSTSNKSIYFGGSKSDNAYELTVIENRVYETDEKAELLLFKGNDNADATGGGTYGPDRIRLKGGQIAFDLSAGYDRTQEDIRAVMHRNANGKGMLGINTRSPTECLHVYGNIKSNLGKFLGDGRGLSGVTSNQVNQMAYDYKFNQVGATRSSTEWGELAISTATTYPTLALTSNTSSGHTVTASSDVTNAWKVFSSSGSWGGLTNNYSMVFNNPGWYLGSVERIPGYKGEWIELQLPTTTRIYLTELKINAVLEGYQPRLSHVFGSNNGIDYDLIHSTGDVLIAVGNQTIFTRTPDYLNDDPYNRILIIVERLRGSASSQRWDGVTFYGTYGTFSPLVKIDPQKGIGVGTLPSATYPFNLDCDINISTGRNYMINGVPQKFSPWSISGTSNYEIYADNSNNKLSIGTSDFPHLVNIKGSSTTYADLLLTNNTESSSARLLLGTPLNSNSSDLTTCAFKSAIIAHGNTGNSTSDLHFCLNSSTSNDSAGTATLTDSRMVIANHGTYVGNVGIGLAYGNSPAHKLHVVGDIGLTGSLKEITTGNDWLPSITTGGGIINDNGSLRIDLAASAVQGVLGVSGGGTGVDGTAHDANGLFYYGSAVHTTLAPPTVNETILLTDTAGDAPLWALISDGLSVATTSGPGPTKEIKVSLDTTSGGLAFNNNNELKVSLNANSGGLAVNNNNELEVSLATANAGLGFNSSNELEVSLDANGGLGFNNSNQLRIDFTNTSSIVGQLPASFVSGGGSGSSNVVAWVYNSSAGPPEVIFDEGGNGYIAAIGGSTDMDNILTISGSVKIDQGSSNLSGYGSNGDLDVYGMLSKGSGSFKIDHPLPSMSNTHTLCHSFIEGPKADLIYRGKVNLVNGSASINLDTVSNMTSGTFEALNRDVQCFTTNESDWDAVKGSVSGNTLTISCQNASSTANVSWLVIGERKDKHMYDTHWTDDDGHVVPEKAKST